MDPAMNFVFENNLFEEDLEIIDLVNFGFPRRRYERSNYYENLDELQFFQRFRLRKNTAYNVLTTIEDQLEFYHDWYVVVGT